MNLKSNPPPREFDRYAADYDRALAQGLSASGEDKNYFARGRVAWLADNLRRQGVQPRTLLDFGCGTGSATPFLAEFLQFHSLLGVDVSPGSLDIARQAHGSDRVHFTPLHEYQPSGEIDLAFCNGVFHHIPPADRPGALRVIHRSLRPGGIFSFWENNPWNPGTRYVMSRIPFDRDAITLTPPDARRLLREAGFEIARTDFLFIFPRTLSWFRPLERLVSRLPLGGQYQILCRNLEVEKR